MVVVISALPMPCSCVPVALSYQQVSGCCNVRGTSIRVLKAGTFSRGNVDCVSRFEVSLVIAPGSFLPQSSSCMVREISAQGKSQCTHGEIKQ